MSTNAIVGDLQEVSISSSAEIMETNSSSSSWASTGVLTSTEITSTAYDNELVTSYLPLATPCVAAEEIGVGSHSFTFDKYYSRRKGLRVGKCLVSDTFTAGGYDWAITLYPNGRKDKCKGYISLYIRLESEATDVNALFELILVDQSGMGKHRIQTHFGRLQEKQPFMMRRSGSQWGSGLYMNKKHLKKSGFLKDNCLIVKCVVGVLAVHTEKEVPSPSNLLLLSEDDQNIQVLAFQGPTESNCKNTKLPDLESAAKIIAELGSPLQLQGLVNDGDRNKFIQYLSAVDEIQRSIKSGMISGYKTQGALAIKTLQLVFRGILDCSISETESDPLNSTDCSSSVTSSYGYEFQGSNHTGFGELSSEQVYYLHSIVETLNSAGCVGPALRCTESQESLRWMKAYKCYNSIFPGERQYFEQIFDGVGVVTNDNCFLAIVKHAAIELNNFADSVSYITSFQKLFSVLDLYKVLVVILPEIQNMYHSVSFANISHGASNTSNNLATQIRKLFYSFEDTVLNEQLNTPSQKGKIHLLTEYAMKYVTNISQHKELLTDIIVSRPTTRLGNHEDEQVLEACSGTPLRIHVIWIIMCLRSNLEGKSSFYKDVSVRSVFILNNVDYIIKTVEESPELLDMIGKEYLSRLSKNVLQAAQDYFSSIWHKVLICLRDDKLNYNEVSQNYVKERFKTFNTTFEVAFQTQRRMLLPDIHMDGQLHRLILSKLLPAYKSFLKKFGSNIQSEKYMEIYIKYSAEDLVSHIKLLFSG
ncbi:hypothetical protein POM88_033983 [Heracleum sosnowskyi]|uniref:Exocyst subunit Exo70 family protein n=1 Tax=Heracleum sosnowskyi TaxID=360622 RepID=A0AAD8MBT8_9APIA|nr:hypothetical protein POM88_033983 [Heracleum sosnowskyi]